MSRFIFHTWSDEKEREHLVVLTSDSTFTAEMGREYWLSLHSDHGNPQGAGWYADGSTAEISIEPNVAIVPSETRIVFDSWSGSGSDSYSGSDNPATLTVTGDHTIGAIFKVQVFLPIIMR